MNIGKLKNRLVNERFWFLRRPIQIAGDLAILSVAFFFSYLPTINIRLADFYEEIALLQVPLVVLVQFAVLFLFGAYNIIWRYIGLNDLKIFLASAFVSALILLSIRFFFSGFVPDDWKIPVSVILIDTALGFGGILGVRIFRRLIYEMTDTPESFPKGARRFRHKTLVVGAGRLGSMAVEENCHGRRAAEGDGEEGEASCGIWDI